MLPVALRTDIAIIAMKPLGDRHILDARVVAPLQMLHYSMNLPVATVVTGIDSLATLDQAVTAAVSFRPLSGAQAASMLARSAPLSIDARPNATRPRTSTTARPRTPSGSACPFKPGR